MKESKTSIIILINIFILSHMLIFCENTIKENNLEIMQLEELNSLKQQQNDTSTFDSFDQTKQTKINSDMQILGRLSSNKFYSNEAKITGDVNIDNLLTSKKIVSDKIITKVIYTDKIVSPAGVLTIEGDLILGNDISADTISMRGSSFILEGERQWGLFKHDNFETESSLEGWSDKRTSRCKDGSKNTYLGGHCNFSYTEVNKLFKNLPAHSSIRINASFHMLDSWDGETGYMKVNNEIVWSKKGQHSPEKGINICGGDFNDPEFNIPIDVTLPHTNEEILISFGSTLDEEPCNESFAIDDVMIYIK